ncbi:DUF4328 domain-containing protein [Gordonia terrae]|uniref:DUF4328 domain-containing protein n=1 Tax=Gordonia terrae TaxID=2055 RepID=A0AAD0K3J4_9ACTN|nr:DUF4328 domain-containing protein [Gordonia terrae]AWO82364.1 DUF4328 domain-containing protein [Gordonia terrae]VTR08903.1 Uncharacterised protein [Clostridioides difficile]VTS18052.1 Uncharacterised protein [Gordonia terrae]
MIDLCPRCRIQAPHRPGRERCPRCGGPLSVVDDAARALAARRESSVRPSGPGHPGPRHPGPTSAPAGRLYRSRNVRWVARRPPEAVPARRGPVGRRGPRLIPRYVYVPTWGLHDEPTTADAAHQKLDDSRSRLGLALVLAGSALTASALVHLVRYILLVVNRDRPLPEFLIIASDWLTVFVGVVAFLGFVLATLAFMRWVLELRADTYASAGLLDPRRPGWVAALSGLPLVNLIGAPLVLQEVAAHRVGQDPSLDADLVGRRLRKLWVAWILVNVAAGAAIVARLIAWRSDSLQTGANALAMVIVSTAISAAFAFWMARRVRTLFGAAAAAPVPTRRWVAVG